MNINYAAKIVKLQNPNKHPNADKLLVWNIDGMNVITSLDYKEGDEVVYFPLECQINNELISNLSLFRDKNLNKDTEKVGFFEKGRVKALKLRGVPSQGFVLDIESLQEFIKEKTGKEFDKPNGFFDTLNGINICKKYVVRENHVSSRVEKSKKTDIIPDQFNFHYDTSRLNLFPWLLKEGDIGVITGKLHGTNFVSSKVLVDRKLTLLEKVSKFFGAKIDEREYKYICSSRRIIKKIGEEENSQQGYYKENVWLKAHDRVKHCLLEGMTLYGEIVGYDGNSYIQKGYDYGCSPGEFDVYIFRITTTYPNGEVYEWSWLDIKNFCNENEIKHVPEYYYGPINFTLEDLSKDYLEKDCVICKNNVPDEGICFRNESKDKKAFKMKSFRFYERETKALDKGEVSLEDEN